jgi:GAF domain-containing protein
MGQMPDSIQVLHVEDDPAVATLVAESLTRYDDRFDVTTVDSPGRALELLEEHRFECILSDYSMPERDGLELLDDVRESCPHLPFILFTGDGDETVASRAISADVTDYVEKDVGHEAVRHLASRIIDHVERYRIRQTLDRRLSQQQLVADIGQRALAGVDSQTLFEHAVEGVADTLDADYAKVLEYHPEDGELLLRAGVGWRDGLVGHGTVDDGEDSQAGHTVRSEEPIIVEDLRTEERFRGPPLLTDHDVVSGISVIIGAPESPWGVLGVHTTVQRVFTRDDVNFVQSVANVLATAIDRERRTNDLERQNQRLEEFASIVSHDLRTPMAAASGYLSLAREEHDDPHLDRVSEALEQMGVLIDEVLSLVRGGDWAESCSEVDLGGLVSSCWELVKTDDATLRLETDRDVRADRRSLKRLVSNLLTNAVTHGGEGVTVTVGDLPDGFFVADDGPGIDPTDRERIFEAGYSTAEGGTGLGLDFAGDIIEAHGWTLSVTESDSGGARFEITGLTQTEASSPCS